MTTGPSRGEQLLRDLARRALAGEDPDQLRLMVRQALVAHPEAAEAGRLAEEVIGTVEARSAQTAEVALRESLERFEALVESSPDAVLVIDAAGTVVQANGQVRTLLGYEPAEICGRPIEALIPSRYHGAHRAHRDEFIARPRSRSMGVGLELYARRADGREIPVDVALGSFTRSDGPAVTAFVRDVTQRKRADELALRLHDADVRRRHGLEINDNVVQGLAAAIYDLDAGQVEDADRALRRTLGAARSMMNEMLGAPAERLVPGTLRRVEPSSGREGRAGNRPPLRAPDSQPHASDGPGRVLIVDDDADIRLLMRMILGRAGFVVVGEAGDGAEGVRLAGELQPALVLLDLSMPVMDGLEALPHIKGRAPDAKIIVLSGFDRRRLERDALDAGADAYVEKGAATARLVDVATTLCPVANPPAKAGPPEDLAADSALAHELRTPLTVIHGIASTLRTNADALPSGAFHELLDALVRNADHINAMLDTFSDATRLGTRGLELTAEPLDVDQLVAEVVGDLASILAHHRVEIEAPVAARVVADRSRLRQVLTNLLTNAARYTPAGTLITVNVSDGPEAVEVSCTDAGPGVPPERQGELFRRFSRLGQAVPGMGLGLFISRGIARAHGGDLDYRNAPGGGASFVLTLPKERRPVRSS